VRKHLGYSHIPQRFASLVNAFCRDQLNPYINFHRPFKTIFNRSKSAA